MGLFSKKASPAPIIATPATQPAQVGLVDNPKTLILSFLHEASKGTGMREFIKNYAFQGTPEQRFLVLVEMKDNCVHAPNGVLFARWQLFQLEAMRWATSKGIALAGLACTFPLDKATPLAELKARAQLQLERSAQATATLQTALNKAAVSASHAAASRVPPDTAPESQIEVSHDDSDAADEFFRLTQPPSQS